jgi:hypothetical protein
VINGIYYALLLPMLGKNTEVVPISVVLIGVLASFSIGSIWVAFVLVPLVAAVHLWPAVRPGRPWPLRKLGAKAERRARSPGVSVCRRAPRPHNE